MRIFVKELIGLGEIQLLKLLLTFLLLSYTKTLKFKKAFMNEI